MASPFAAAIAAAAATHDKIMADDFEFRPMKPANDRNAPAIVDPDRAIWIFRAPFTDSAARVHSDAARTPGVKPERPGYASTRPALSLNLALLPYAPRRGDVVAAILDPGALVYGKKYVIAEIVPGTPGFVRLDLNEI